MGDDGAGGNDGEVGGTVARAKAVKRRGLRRRGAPDVPARSGATAVLGGMEGGTIGGERGEEGGEHPLFVPG